MIDRAVYCDMYVTDLSVKDDKCVPKLAYSLLHTQKYVAYFFFTKRVHTFWS